MHVAILLTDPLSSLNFADKLKEQLNGVIIVNLMEGTGEPSSPGATKAVSPVKEQIKKKQKAERNSLPSLRSKVPRKIAKTISPAHKPVHVAKAPKVDSAPISRPKEEVLPPEPRFQRELPPKTEEVPPVPVEQKVQEPEPPPIPAESPPTAKEVPPAPVEQKVQEPEQPPIPRESPPTAKEVPPLPVEQKVTEPEPPPMIAAGEPDITISDNLKPKPDAVKPADKPPLQEVHEPVKPETPPSTPVEVAPVVPEERREPPVKQEPVKTEAPPVAASVQEVHGPVKPEAPPPTPVEVAPVVPEERHEPPVHQEPVKTEAPPVAAPVQEVHEPVKPEVQPSAPIVAAAEPEKKHEAPVIQEPARAEVQPLVSPVPQEAPNNTPPSVTIDKVKVEPPLPERGPDPQPVIANPPDIKNEEKEKGGTDSSKKEVLTAKNVPVAPAIIEDQAKVKAPEAQSKAVATQAAALVNKKTTTLSLLKRFETDKEPIRIGIPISRPTVKITTPAIKKVRNRVQEIAGQVKGNGITRAILSLNGDIVTVPVENDKFHWEGVLKDGQNTISASVWDRNRYSAKDQITVEAMPAVNGFALSIEEPGAGEVKSPVISVKGMVGDSTVDTVKLIVNRESVEAAVENGSFEKTVLLNEGDNSLQAEAVNAKGVLARSSVLKVMVTNQKTPDILVHLYWEDPNSELRTKLARKKRDNLEDEQGAVSTVEVSAIMSAHEGYRERIFAVYEAKAGAYILSVTGGKTTKCLISVTLPAKRKTRLFGPVPIPEEGTVIGRLLMSEGIFWDEDEWFTATIEDGDSVTKYNSPEGLTWKEMK
jgi:hypothetical protein